MIQVNDVKPDRQDKDAKKCYHMPVKGRRERRVIKAHEKRYTSRPSRGREGVMTPSGRK